ncbi:MAG TPA: hypothetical protein VMV68_00400, partial [Spirochaetia bacterium]|nr:hypothetical protein [Spirochaetia bacterium]
MEQNELTGFSVAKLPDVVPDAVLSMLGRLDWIPAKIGRSIHYDLMEAGKLANPYGGHAAAVAAQYVPQSDWVYRASFDLPRAILDSAHRFIELECVDTFADVYVNKLLVGQCSNMFTPWQFDLSKAGLKERGNELYVHIKGHARMVADRADESEERIGCDGRAPEWARERSLVRRYQRSYAEDFCYVGQAFWGIGLVRPVKILAFPKSYIDEYELVVSSVGAPDYKRATAAVHVAAGGAGGSLTARAVLTAADGAVSGQGESSLAGGAATITLDVPSPKLWWPHGYGEPYLYTLTVSLSDSSGVLHTVSRQVGLKEIRLSLKGADGRQDFSFFINGKPMYARGSNLIPIDVLNAGGTPQQVEDLLKLAVNSNMNMMRLWGGGMPEPDWYYSLCDRYGILLWKDAHLHSHTYPDYDERWNEEVRRETIVMIKQLRSHACFA